MTSIGKRLAQAYLDDSRHTDASGRIQTCWIMDDHFQRAHDEGVAVARDAFLNMICDARRFEEEIDGDEVNGRTVITCDYHFTVDHDSLEELANALGIRRPIMTMENIGDAIWRQINADVEANAAQAFEAAAADETGTGSAEGESPVRQDAPHPNQDTPHE